MVTTHTPTEEKVVEANMTIEELSAAVPEHCKVTVSYSSSPPHYHVAIVGGPGEPVFVWDGPSIEEAIPHLLWEIFQKVWPGGPKDG
jgi:hypothetical protein